MKGINKIKIVIVGLFVITQSLCLFSEDALFDFDGRNNKTNQVFSNDLKISKPEIKPLPDIELRIMDENGQAILFNPTTSSVNENGIKTFYYTIPPGYAVEWIIQCSGNGNWGLTLNYGFTHDKYGGHYHYSPAAPPLRYGGISEYSQFPPVEDFYSAPSPINFPILEGNSKKYYYYLWYPEFATKVIERISAWGACGNTIDYDLSIKVNGLINMTTGQNYVLVGQTKSHPYNHYGTSEMNKSLINLANNYNSSCPKASVLYYNDISLEWGGLFDVNGDWKTPHTTHRYGTEIDISKKSITKSNRKKFIEIACKDFMVRSEGDESYETAHYHLILRTTPQKNLEEILNILDSDQRYIKCCPEGQQNTTIPEKCVLLYDHGELITENDTPTNCQ